VVFLLVVGAVGYVGTLVIPAYWAYLSLIDPVKEAAMAAAPRPEDEASVRTRLIENARVVGVALTDDDIEITRGGLKLAIRVSWVVPVDLPRYRYNLRFHIEQTALLP
jgi:hypothetical protein